MATYYDPCCGHSQKEPLLYGNSQLVTTWTSNMPKTMANIAHQDSIGSIVSIILELYCLIILSVSGYWAIILGTLEVQASPLTLQVPRASAEPRSCLTPKKGSAEEAGPWPSWSPEAPMKAFLEVQVYPKTVWEGLFLN